MFELDGIQWPFDPLEDAAITANIRKNRASKRAAVTRAWQKQNPERYRASKIAWQKQNPEKRREYFLRRSYGIGLDDYNTMMIKQENKCLICRREFVIGNKARSPVVDHCHNTGRVRGILCHNCNSGLGLLEDDLTLFSRAIAYIQGLLL
jgi:hypothetical protein